MKNWYVVHTQTGFENKVKTILETGIAAKGLQDAISRIVIPTEQISEIRSGKKKVSERHYFPGYILVEMEMADNAYSFIKAIPGVTGFIGSGKKPTPLSASEVESILKKTEETKLKPSPKVIFEKVSQSGLRKAPL